MGTRTLLALAAALLQTASAVPWTAPPPVPCNPHASPPEVCPVSGVVCPPSGFCPSTAADNVTDPTLVHTLAGPLRGIAGEKYRMWLGVPFAEPPLAELRWMPPREKRSWAPETFEAFDKRDNCAQSSLYGGWSPSSPDEPHGSSEDCLYMVSTVQSLKSCARRAVPYLLELEMIFGIRCWHVRTEYMGTSNTTLVGDTLPREKLNSLILL